MSTKKRAPKAEIPIKLIAYKGFDKDLKCRDHQYEIGKSYTHEGPVEKCGSGFHSCEYPLEVFRFYEPATSRYARVTASGELSRDTADSKIASAAITIEAEIRIPDLVSAAVQYILGRIKRTKKGHNTGHRSAATNTGDRSAATNTGDLSAATNTGDWSAATNTGDRSAATNTGDLSAATNTGYLSAATNTGHGSAATNTGLLSAATNTGDRSAATNTGLLSAATNTGDRSAATNTGDWSAATVESPHGKNIHAVAIAVGYQSKAKASLGSAIVCVYRNEKWDLIHIRAGIAGEDVKADTWYMLDENGYFIEV